MLFKKFLVEETESQSFAREKISATWRLKRVTSQGGSPPFPDETNRMVLFILKSIFHFRPPLGVTPPVPWRVIWGFEITVLTRSFLTRSAFPVLAYGATRVSLKLE